MKLLLGDCLDKLKELDDNSVDSIVTDPPYGLSFMGKKWDYDVPSQGIFEECLRVLKPGGHLLSFAGSRTYHRMAVRVEDAGFEIRDQIMWIYGSGFPKSLNIGKGVDKKLGNEREVVGTKIHSQKGVKVAEERTTIGAGAFGEPREADITKGNSEYEGWGTALKPAHEPIVMARKPLSEKTVVDNVLEWGTGGINVEESRIPYKSKDDMEIRKNTHRETNKLGDGNFGGGKYSQPVESGRFPSNIIFDEEAGKILDEQSGISKSTGGRSGNKEGVGHNGIYGQYNGEVKDGNPGLGDKGGASRFFYCPKTSKRDRNEGLENFEGKQIGTYNAHSSDLENYGGSSLGAASMSGNNKMPQPKQNFHPTVKPTDLMLYLIRLVTPNGGTTLDPFMGSGSTGKAAVRGGFDFVGIEREKEYKRIAEARIQYEIDNPYSEEKEERIKINKNSNKFF
jgi:site-specific DNA-methyltransferase (adenine-specific)